MRHYCFLLLLLMVTACSSDEESQPAVAERTIFVYMAAENNLSFYGFDEADLDEMREASTQIDDRYRLIVYVDGPGSDPPYIGRLRGGQLVDSVPMKESLTANPAVLQQMLTYARSKYPAKSYGLVLWGHCNGWLISDKTAGQASARRRAYGGDNGNGSNYGSGNYWMNIPDMAVAIEKAMGNDRLAFIVGDCCNFACVEVAYELRHLTDYVIGSPAEIPGPGAPYHLALPGLFSSTADNYAQFIHTYYDYYYELYNTYGAEFFNANYGDLAGHSVPLAVIRTSALDDLAEATRTILATIPEKLQPGGTLYIPTTNLVHYGYSESYSVAVHYAYDMYQLLQQNTTAEAFAQWKPYFTAAVPHAHASARWLTIYTPLYNSMYTYPTDLATMGSVSMFFPHTMYTNTSPNLNTSIFRFQWASVVRWADYGWSAD